jgi:hypothetical protein
MWEPRRLITLWAFTACYRDSFTFFTVAEFHTTNHTKSSQSTFTSLYSSPQWLFLCSVFTRRPKAPPGPVSNKCSAFSSRITPKRAHQNPLPYNSNTVLLILFNRVLNPSSANTEFFLFIWSNRDTEPTGYWPFSYFHTCKRSHTHAL